MKTIFITLAFSILSSLGYTHALNTTIKEENITLSTSTGDIKGILREPETNNTKTVAIIISGATRTDKDGNQPQTKNNSLKMLAEELVGKDIAVLNFDKRGVGLSQRAGANEAKITLETYITDINDWIDLLTVDNRFEEVVLIGHGEGSLIGIITSIDNPKVTKLISIGGTSKKASEATIEQFAQQPAAIKKAVIDNIRKLENGERITNVPQEWDVLFRSSLQPFLISLYKYDPKEELAKVMIPTLIIQGDKDLQASVEDANLLAKANPKANKVVIENMNYVLKECTKTGQGAQMETYLRPNFPLNKELIPTIATFILGEEAEDVEELVSTN